MTYRPVGNKSEAEEAAVQLIMGQRAREPRRRVEMLLPLAVEGPGEVDC